MTSISDEEIAVWAYTKDYDLIIVEGLDDEPLYGIQNRHTYVIEIQEPIFANAIGYLIDIQEGFDSVNELIDADGYVNHDDPIVLKPKKEGLH